MKTLPTMNETFPMTHNPLLVAPLAGPAVHGLAQGQVARGRHFRVQWIEGPATVEARSTAEMLVLLPEGGAAAQTGDENVALPARSVNIIPAGPLTLVLEAGSRAAIVAHDRPDLNSPAVNQRDYDEPDARVRAVARNWRRSQAPGRVHSIPVDQVTPPADKPRLKMFRTDCLSINWVEYTGRRDRSQLSPHAHADFEQGSLALAGEFVHHLRLPWGPDADAWRADAHLAAPSPSMLTIPVQLVHTTEGTGEGRHLLIDVFSPVREDFIAKGWVSNAADYVRD